MKATNVKRKKVEELSQYGKPLTGLEKEAVKKQEMIFMAEIKKRYGAVGRIPFFIDVFLKQRRVKKEYPEAYSELQKFGGQAVKEFPFLIGIFKAIAKREGRENAYPILKDMFQKVAPTAQRSMYQVDELVDCEGDVFDNFKKFHCAMFEASQHLFHNSNADEKDKLTSIVDKCANVEMAHSFDVPELAPIGCDSDLAGYAAIADEVNIEFRRPCTIAKGGDHCKFLFYRKGTAPDTEEVDGKTVKWDDHLNK
jgi:hypothetical protein